MHSGSLHLTFARWLRLAMACAVVSASCTTILGLDETTLKRPASDAGGDSAVADGSGGTGGSGAQDATGDAGTGADSGTAPAFAADPAKVLVSQDQSTDLTVILARNGLSGAVDVELTGLPPGVTCALSTIAASASSTVLTIIADTTAPIGATMVAVHSRNAAVADLPIELTVGGPPGTLDETFDGDGILTDASDGNAGIFYAVLVQSDGRIVAGGSKTGAAGGGGWAIRRFEDDGTPDATFNQNAAAAMPTNGLLRGLAVDPNADRIVAVGTSFPSVENQLTIVRLNSTGAADDAFANSGRLVFDSVSYPNGSFGYGVVVQADSSIVVVGGTHQGAEDHALLERIHSTTDAADPSFSRYIAPGASAFYSVRLWDAYIVAGGAYESTVPPSTVLLRTDTNGVPDSAFGTGGIFVSADACRANAMVVQPSGGVAAAGRDMTGPRFCATAATSSGAPAWSVGYGNATSETYTAVATNFDEAIIAVGQGGGTFDKYATIDRRLPTDGSLDPAFAASGQFVLEDVATPDTYVYQLHAVAVQADSRIIAAGNKNNAGYALLRLWP